MRVPRRGIDYDVYRDGATADCRYCDEQLWEKTVVRVESEIKRHIEEEHHEVLEESC